MTHQEIDGIVFLNEPLVVDHFDFAFTHLDCDAIIENRTPDAYETDRIVAYSTSKEKNDLLWEIFHDRYADGNYLISRHISKEQMNAIF